MYDCWRIDYLCPNCSYCIKGNVMRAYQVVFTNGVKWEVKGKNPQHVMAKYKLARNTIRTLSPIN